ncbi:MAG: outer membrane protein transport protein [Myxococcales bacterium]|nr:outer membrane protein transport protein [Myxococcales bacterium]
MRARTRHPSRGESLAAALLALSLAAWPGEARAGGMFLTDRGTRPAGRGFAYVAGADAPDAIWYNPAGIAWSGEQLFFDATLTLVDATYTRVDSGGNTLPTESLSHAPIPIPNIAYTSDLGVDDWTFGISLSAPNLVPYKWSDAPDAPQRYSLISLDGSVVGQLALAAAWRPADDLAIGVAAQLYVGNQKARVALSACDGAICSTPENPEWDGVAEISSTILSPTATVGVTYAPGPVRIGASFALPYSFGGPATLRVRLPTAPLFDNARVDGSDADVTLDMPWVARLGVELRAVERLRLEAAAVYEAWSVQDALVVDPDGIWMRNVTAVGDYEVGPVTVPRKMKDVVSLRLGGEYAVSDGFTARVGANWENAASDDAHLTVLTLDSAKLVASVGASVLLTDDLWLDASFSHVFMANRNIDSSRVTQANPIRPPSPGDQTYVGDGRYVMEANMFGLGLRWQLAAAPSSPRAVARN